MQKKNIIICAIIIFAVGSVAFYGGMQYEKSKFKTGQMASGENFSGNNRRIGANSDQRGMMDGQRDGQNGGQRMGGANGAGGFIGGEIISKDDKSITVKSQDGNSKIIFFSDSTTVGKTVDGSASDLSTGQQVMVNGKTNADGTIAAQNIQIRPAQQ